MPLADPRRRCHPCRLSLHTSVKQYRHLRAAPLEAGEPTIALMLLHLPSTELFRRLGVFVKEFADGVADAELSQWLELKLLYTQLSPGIPTSKYVIWSVKIESSARGRHS